MTTDFKLIFVIINKKYQDDDCPKIVVVRSP